MTTISTIDLNPRQMALTREGEFFTGSFKLTLANVSGQRFSARVEVRPEGNTRADWIQVDKSKLLFDFEKDRVEDIAINIKVPISVPADVFGIVARVVDTRLPDELFARITGAFEVPGIDAVPVPTKKPIPGWLIPVIIGGVVLLAGGGLAAYFATAKPGLGDTCDPAKPECADGVACHAERKRCLAATGHACKKDGQCLTNRCEKENKCGPLRLGDACEPAAPLCGDHLECSRQSKRCLGLDGFKCGKNEDCSSGNCQRGGCAAENQPEPTPPPVDPCPWVGTWKTKWTVGGKDYFGSITFTAQGAGLAATYDYGELTFGSSGKSISGRWRHTDGKPSGGPCDYGTVDFTKDGCTFEGKWGWCSDAQQYPWSGTRLE